MNDMIDFDRQHIWHPYSAVEANQPLFHVRSAEGVRITLQDGRELIDGMASWWSVIHGYRHPDLDKALKHQVDQFSHVMFGGLTHDPAIELAQLLVDITPDALETVFFADSGSVSVEVALKMALQYWSVQGQGNKNRFLTVRQGYHGDTFGAMSVCDPVTGMHSLFEKILASHLFAPAPITPFGQDCPPEDIAGIAELIRTHHQDIAAVIIEPIVQGAGGMRFYAADYLRQVRQLCDDHQILLIFDEIATGFGRTGKLFALEHTGICPDILCLGKALTGGYMTMAATLATRDIARVISQHEPGVFMHGPTFMANPLACRVAQASIRTLLSYDWQAKVRQIESILSAELRPCSTMKGVNDCRVLGAIGVIELEQAVDMSIIQPMFVEAGVWVRPFGKLVYVMPPFVISEDDLVQLAGTIVKVVGDYLSLN